MSLLVKLFGDPNRKTVGALQQRVARTNALEAEVSAQSDERLKLTVNELRKTQPDFSALDQHLERVFAIVRETAKRQLKQRPYDVQLIGGMALNDGQIAEMRTGEGKTLVATLPATLNALTGRGVHVVTVNDYLAKRDAVWMGPIYQALGVTVGSIQHEAAFRYDPTYTDAPETARFLRPVSRREAYACDVLYGTNNEFGFDYLRDNMVADVSQKVQRPLAYAIVDEVDSILVDEARTPLIISAPAEESTDQYYRFAQLVRTLTEGEDYNVDEKMKAATLTDAGMTKMERALGVENIYAVDGIELAHHMEQALKAHALFKLDRDYVVRAGEVVIVDEFTGRLMFGRRYSEGLHQAIEAKEGVAIKQESRTLATITFQNYFRLYQKLSGMTGTALTEAEEFAKIYNLDVVVIPTNRPMVRADRPDAVFVNEQGKFQAVVREIKSRHQAGQPVLVGTISIEKNEILHELLEREGVPHEVLNAKNHEREAAIIAQAGRKGAVTIATNMAGRGVDIILGGTGADKPAQDEIRALGGVHVLGTERHEARRIDNQLRGRTGRQGDPGSSQFFVSLDDDLMRVFGSDRVKGIMERLNVPPDLPIENRVVSRSIEAAQKKIEGRNFDLRKHLVEYDDVMNKHREVIYRRRNRVLAQAGSETLEQVSELVDAEIEHVVAFHTAGEHERDWNLKEIVETVDAMFGLTEGRAEVEGTLRDIAKDRREQAKARDAMCASLSERADQALQALGKRLGGDERLSVAARSVLLRTIDALWIEHLDQMDHLREGIGLRGYGQRDPLVEYKREAFRLFQQLTQSIDASFVNTLFKIQPAPPSTVSTTLTRARQVESGPAKESTSSSAIRALATGEPARAPGAQLTAESQEPTATAPGRYHGQKVGRNEPCPCGSGKKFKKCHGA
ncbi:MAG: preprotein translocase subunit SecA [Candidatus Kerfeldbacteria bacterium]|nr:preprotein translocase subunit SecA [Candidatus Kerfeldbacteria bacterium]